MIDQPGGIDENHSHFEYLHEWRHHLQLQQASVEVDKMWYDDVERENWTLKEGADPDVGPYTPNGFVKEPPNLRKVLCAIHDAGCSYDAGDYLVKGREESDS